MKTSLALLFLLLYAGCSPKKNGKPANVDHYTCAMHPSVYSELPGTCPICGMDLIPVMKQAGTPAVHTHEMSGPATFMVPVARQQQIGVTYAKVERKPLQRSIRAAGVVAPDKSKHWEFVARVDGYVQQLFVTSPGEIVAPGQPLLTIYSPDLLTTERELIELLRMRRSASGMHAATDSTEQLIESARRRLRQWNVADEQIAEIEKLGSASDKLTLLSPFRGVVEAVPVDQGRSVKMGDHLVDLLDLSMVWVWADFYQNELPLLVAGQEVSISAQSLPGEMFPGKIAQVDPTLDAERRTARVRIEIANPDFKLRPGMFVDVELRLPTANGLAVSANAVLPTGTHNLVFVDRGEGRLEPRDVELGGRFGDFYEVKSGLAEGDQVVASANFLIDAEAGLQGALKSFGEAPSSGHHHD